MGKTWGRLTGLKRNVFCCSMFLMCAAICLLGKLAWSAPSEAGSADGLIKEKQVVEINKSLKNVIEENQKLAEQNQELKAQVDQASSEHRSAQSEVEQLRQERDALSENIKKVKDSNREYLHEMKAMQSDYQQLQQVNEEYSSRLNTMESQRVNTEEPSSDEMVLASATNEDVKTREMKTLDLLTRIDAFNEADEKLKEDAAKAHYNMGNIYFQKGEFEIAAREYYQAVTLMPDDPDSHYNLALISGEYLNDQSTALKHYQMYLYLNPEAKDADFVKEKIIHAKMLIGATVDSHLEDKTEK